MNHFLFVSLALALITTTLTAKQTISAPIKDTIKLLQVPIIRQSTPYSCGPASLLSVLYYWKISSEGEIFFHEPLKVDKESGTHPVAIVEFAKTLGLKVELKTGVSLLEIEMAIDRKEPVIVDYQAWEESETKDYSAIWNSGHYGVVIGYDSVNFYFMDPVLGTSYGKLEKKDFLNRWHDFETINNKIEYFIQSAIFISGVEKLSSFPSDIKPIK